MSQTNSVPSIEAPRSQTGGAAMIQCRACRRFSVGDDGCCSFCRSRDIEVFVPSRAQKHREEHRAYKIAIRELEIDGDIYSIDGPLARGGCSVILKVAARSGEGVFALKVPFVFDEIFTNRQGNSATALRKSEKALWDEIHTFDRVESPHTLYCLFKGAVTASLGERSATFPVILMELALTSLEHLIFNNASGQNPIPLEEKFKIIDDLIDSVFYLHKNRLVHRDISPANIFAVRRGTCIRYIVSDYGSSRHGDDISSSRFSSSILANYLYLDPQRLLEPAFAYDPRSDIYSVGVVMAEIFAGNFWHAVASNPIRDGEPINFPRDVLKPCLANSLDRRLRKIVARATASRPGRRYATITALKSSWDNYARASRRDSQTTPLGKYKQTAEPILLAIMASLLVLAMQPAIRFFAAQSSQLALPAIPSNLQDITRLVISGDIQNLERRLQRDGYSDAHGPNGWTPLHWAMYLKRYKIARLLMDHGASWNTSSVKSLFNIPAGTTPRQLFLQFHPALQSHRKGKKSREGG